MATTLLNPIADPAVTVEIRPIPMHAPGRADADIPCALTVDVEGAGRRDAEGGRVAGERAKRDVDVLLAQLAAEGVKGTFFVKGIVAERFPRLVAALVADGHEVQSHGYSHRPLDGMSLRELRDELERAKAVVEDAAGTPVTAFRAPGYSIVNANLWALEVLADAGFTVDSSIYPRRAARYGIHGWEMGPHRIVLPSGASIAEVPIAMWPCAGARVVVAGGRSCRLMPGPVLERAIRDIRTLRQPVVMDVRADELTGRVLRRLTGLFHAFPFGRLDSTLTAWIVS